MEVNIKISSEDHLILDNFQKENESKENIIESVKENLKDNFIYSQDFIESDYSYNLEKVKNNEYNIEINCKDKIKEEIKTKLKSCEEKEKILNSKKEQFHKLINDLEIDEKLLEKKLFSLLGKYTEKYDIIVNQIVELFLDYDDFSKEAALLQEKIIKYRSSKILQLCFKIFWQRFHGCIVYILKKYIIFIYNERLFKMTSKLVRKFIRIIIDDLYDIIFKKISENKIFLDHKESYQKKLKMYKEICYCFYILQSFDKDSEKIIFNIEEDMDLKISENTFDNIGRFNYHILKRTGLNVPLESFLSRVNIDEMNESYFKKILLLYEKYKTIIPIYKICTFLFE